MNRYSNANNPFEFEQDLNNTDSAMVDKWIVVAALSDVYLSQGEKIGEVKALLRDPETNILEYAVFQFDAVLGFGEKTCFLPWDKFNIENLKKVLFIPVGLKTLSEAPFFHQNHWPDNTEGYLKDVKEYWGRN